MEKVMYYLERIGKLIVRFKNEILLAAFVIFLIFSINALSKKDGSFIIYVAITVALGVFYFVTRGLVKV